MRSRAACDYFSVKRIVEARHPRRILCVFPAYAPAFGTFSHAFRLTGAKAFMPPQGMLLIANYLPSNWEVRFVDENIQPASAAGETEAGLEKITRRVTAGAISLRSTTHLAAISA